MGISKSSDVGNIREINQDRVNYKVLGKHEMIAVLCDGMGGHKAGEVAASLTCDYISDHFTDHPEFKDIYDIKKWIATLIKRAHEIVLEKSKSSPEYEGMGTTVVVCYILDDHVYISHVGDSRVYFINHGHLKQMTVDDTLVNALLQNGFITESQAKIHPQKNVLVQAVGVTSPLRVSFYESDEDLEGLLLCSDGLYNSLTIEQIEAIINSNLSSDEKCQKLIHDSKKYGGFDNISVLLVERGTNS